MNPLTVTLCKVAFGKTDVDRLIPDETGVVGAASDAMLFPSAQRRAGRARGLAESLGNAVPMSVNSPATSRVLHSIGGGGLGAVLGGAIGHLLPNNQNNSQRVDNTRSGILAGGSLGTVLGLVYDTMKRRRQVLGVKQEALEDMADGKDPSPAIGRGNPLAALASGVHQQGRADVAQAIALGKKNFRGNPVMTALQVAGYLPMVGGPAGFAQMAGSGFNYMDSSTRLENSEPRAVRRIR